MTEIPELPQRKSGSLLAVAMVEFLLRGDDVALSEVFQGADVLEIGFATTFLAGHLAAYIRVTAEDPLAVVAAWRRELLDG